jgi:hypothetical protein
LVTAAVYGILLLTPIPYGIALAKGITLFNFVALPFVVRLLLVVVSTGALVTGCGLYIRIFWNWKKIVRLVGDGKINSQESISYLALLKRLLLFQLLLEPIANFAGYAVLWPETHWIRDLSFAVTYYVFSFGLYTGLDKK